MTLLEELEAADPARDVVMSPELAARVLRRRPRRLPVLLPSLGVIAASLVAVLWSRGDSPDLAAKAYAATSGKGIVHWRMDFPRSGQRQEGWQLGQTTRELNGDIVHGTFKVTGETITTARRVRYWSTADFSWHTRARTKESPGNNPLPNGDPFVNFRKAYKAGKLKALGGGRFDVRLKNFRAGDVVYQVDPQTGRPISLTIKPGTVVRFSVYETLPVTAANRRLLAPGTHPGPGEEPASKYFAALRTGSPPPEDELKQLRADFRHMGPTNMQLDVDASRKIADNVWLVPGKGFVCTEVDLAAQGRGSNCRALRSAAKSGLGLGNESWALLVVPDGVKAVRAREYGTHDWHSYPVENGVVRLPGIRYMKRFVR